MQLKKRMESLEQIISMGEKLLTTFDVAELLDSLVTNICRLLEADGATLYLVDPIGKKLISQSIKSDNVEEIALNLDNSSIAGHTALSRKSLNIKDVYADLSNIHPDLNFNREVDARSGKRTKNIITAPLIIHDDLIGVFQVLNKQNGDFSEDDQMILRNFCLVAGIAIMNARLMERVLEAQSSHNAVIENISDLVIIQNAEHIILHLNKSALEYIDEKNPGCKPLGKKFSEVFPEFANLKSQINRVIDHHLDKSVSNGYPSYVILTEKNFNQEIEKVILILRKHEQKDILPPCNQYPKD